MDVVVRAVSSMAQVDPGAWDALAAPLRNPFLSWGYLALLEASGSIGPDTGWHPSHLLAHQGGRLVAAAPFYRRTTSRGDYLMDEALVRTAEALRVPYHPRLVGMVPVTPAPVWRVLTAPGEPRRDRVRQLLDQGEALARETGCTGLHLAWLDPEQAAELQEAGSGEGGFPWDLNGFLWTDDGFGDFEGYLQVLRATRRHAVRTDRQRVAEAGLVTRVVLPLEAARRPGLLERMADFHEDTCRRHGGPPYLNRAFFQQLPEFLPNAGWLLAAAFRPDDLEDPVGLCFLMEGPDTLWSRHWGARIDLPGLHFELTYYLPITHALATGRRWVDGGRGGQHKAPRGFEPTLSRSWHLPFDPRLRKVYVQALPLLNAAAHRVHAEAQRALPWRRDTPRT